MAKKGGDQMIKITFLDGTVEEFPDATEVRDRSPDQDGKRGMFQLIRPAKIIAAINSDLIRRIDYE